MATTEGADAQVSRLDLDALFPEARLLPQPPAPPAPLRRRRPRAGPRAQAPGAAPSPLETYLAERLQEAGVAGRDEGGAIELRGGPPANLGPLLPAHRRGRAPLFHQAARAARRGGAQRRPSRHPRPLTTPTSASLEDLVRLEARCARSITAQAPAARPPQGDARARAASGRCAGRSPRQSSPRALPYRLTARFPRQRGRPARPPSRSTWPCRGIWWATTFVDGLGIVSTTSEMRRRAASDYNLRLGVLL